LKDVFECDSARGLEQRHHAGAGGFAKRLGDLGLAGEHASLDAGLARAARDVGRVCSDQPQLGVTRARSHPLVQLRRGGTQLEHVAQHGDPPCRVRPIRERLERGARRVGIGVVAIVKHKNSLVAETLPPHLARLNLPDAFGEPGIFLIRPDGTIYMAALNSMPAARPRIDDVVQAIEFFTDRSYPPRGEA